MTFGGIHDDWWGFSIAMPAPTDGNGFEAESDGRQMGYGGDPGLTQEGSTIQPAEPRSVLKNGKLVLGIEGNDGLQHRRKVFRLAQHAAQFVQPLILVPVEIKDQLVQFHVELADLAFQRRNVGVVLAIPLASASSSFSSPRSNCVSHNWMRLAEPPYVRCASRRPMTPLRIS